jgi:DNA polymerase-4
LGRNSLSPEEIDAIVVAIVDRVSRRLRGAHRVCRTVVLRLRFDDFSRATRSHTLPFATSQTETILATVRALLMTAAPLVERAGLTLVGLSLANLDDTDAIQLELPFGGRHPVLLDGAVDDIRDRFGTAAITRAVLLGRDPGMTMPMLPD